VKDADNFFLESGELQDANNVNVDEVREIAPRVLEVINGAARASITGFRPVDMGGVSQIDDEGQRHHCVLVQDSITVRSRVKAAAVVIRSDGSVHEKQQEKPDRIEPTFSLAERNTNVADALRIFGKGDLSWFDLYKIFEIIRDDLGGQKNLLDAEFVLKKDLSRFRQTAQHPEAIGDKARHARIGAEVPKDPMAIVEASLLISALLQKSIASKF